MKNRRIYAVTILVFIFSFVFPTLSVGGTNTCKKCNSPLISHAAKEPTCTEDGNRIYHTCSNPDCDYTTLYDTYGELSNFRPRLGHLTEKTAEKPATCTENGRTAGEKCTREGCDYECYTVIEATGHSETTINAVKATCTTDGNTGTVKCINCGITLKNPSVIPATGHNKKSLKAIPANCTTFGLTEGVYCSTCNITLIEQKTVPATGHTFGNGIDDGNYVVYTCTVCGYKKTEKTQNTDIISLPDFMSVSGEFCRINSGTKVTDTNAVVKNGKSTVSSTAVLKTGYLITLNNGKTYSVAVPGDTDKDGKLSIEDARNALRQAVGITKYKSTDLLFCVCDFDGNRKTEINDARSILRIAIGIE